MVALWYASHREPRDAPEMLKLIGLSLQNIKREEENIFYSEDFVHGTDKGLQTKGLNSILAIETATTMILCGVLTIMLFVR